MNKVRVYEVARELGMNNRELQSRIQSLGIQVRNHMSALEPAEVERVRRALEKDKAENTVEERISKTVIRRRTTGKKDPAPAVDQGRTSSPGERPSRPEVEARTSAPAPRPVAEVARVHEAPRVETPRPEVRTPAPEPEREAIVPPMYEERAVARASEPREVTPPPPPAIPPMAAVPA